jgi:hypothetical protein
LAGWLAWLAGLAGWLAWLAGWLAWLAWLAGWLGWLGWLAGWLAWIKTSFITCIITYISTLFRHNEIFCLDNNV